MSVPAPLVGFEAWWTLYPRKTKKQEARKAWARLRPSPQLRAEMLAALTWQIEQRDWDDPQFIPMPATYLNQQRWTDEPLPAARDRSGPAWAWPDRSPWNCPHLTQCDNRAMCEAATILDRPRKES